MARAGERTGCRTGPLSQPGAGPGRSLPESANAGRREGLVVSATVIDARMGLRPAEPVPARAELAALQEKASSRDARGTLEIALRGDFQGRTAVVSSFGAESA